ncbi:hypothetical protein-signal peptide prediction [Rhodopirellula baltica SH 1]|uniref:Uncharacterized protein n=1 Tax=Rhodopirellula baltica (strain DSM 10527 / NCIMB 13988 / SH1) TaxID=243090 RepID=Q7UHJ1_RHOBA|nr:hypothetical protein-signal peptide prediction [Rhodopirellula baltica SH 1]
MVAASSASYLARSSAVAPSVASAFWSDPPHPDRTQATIITRKHFKTEVIVGFSSEFVVLEMMFPPITSILMGRSEFTSIGC